MNNSNLLDDRNTELGFDSLDGFSSSDDLDNSFDSFNFDDEELDGIDFDSLDGDTDETDDDSGGSVDNEFDAEDLFNDESGFGEDTEDTDSSEEGCLSLPAIHEKVIRPTRIRVQWMDENFEQHDEWVEGYLARVMQHEFDHLDGKMFIDRISALRKQLIKNKLKALTLGRYRCGYKTKPVRR